MNKKQDDVKLRTLQFFSKSTAENFQREIDSVIQLVRDGRITFENALNRLHKGKDDALAIYWNVVTSINSAQTDLKTLCDYQRMKKVNPDFPPTNRILTELLKGFEDFQAGTIDYQSWEGIAVKCLSQIKGETRAVKDEIHDILRQSKELVKERQKAVFTPDEQEEVIRGYKQAQKDMKNEDLFEVIGDEVPDDDMAIQKIHKKPC